MNIVFELGAVLFTWEPTSLVQAHLGAHAPTAEASAALVREMFDHEDWLGFDRGTDGLDDAIGRMALRLSLPKASRTLFIYDALVTSRRFVPSAGMRSTAARQRAGQPIGTLSSLLT